MERNTFFLEFAKDYFRQIRWPNGGGNHSVTAGTNINNVIRPDYYYIISAFLGLYRAFQEKHMPNRKKFVAAMMNMLGTKDRNSIEGVLARIYQSCGNNLYSKTTLPPLYLSSEEICKKLLAEPTQQP